MKGFRTNSFASTYQTLCAIDDCPYRDKVSSVVQMGPVFQAKMPAFRANSPISRIGNLFLWC